MELAKAREAKSRVWVINSGNANAATGEPGRHDAEQICACVADQLTGDATQVQPFSTGVIGERLNVPLLQQAAQKSTVELKPDGWLAAAKGHRDTDTVAKLVSRRVTYNGRCRHNGMAKGSGMIKPDMATMLAFVACNAKWRPSYAGLQEACGSSFNRISVDGDTSTNDCFMLAATGVATLQKLIRWTIKTSQRYWRSLRGCATLGASHCARW